MQLTDAPGKQPENREPGFGDHLETLRTHLIRILIYIVIFSTLGFIFKTFIFDHILFKPVSPDFLFSKLLCKFGRLFNSESLCNDNIRFSLINTQVTGQFMLHIGIAVFAGIVLALPLILFEIWKFIRPALTFKEISSVKGIVFYASVLFFIGLLFGYFLITPLIFSFFGSYVVSASLNNLFTIHSYLSVLIQTCIATAIAFELPLIIFFLSKAGITTPEILKKYRRHAIVVLFIFAAIITPADPFSMILVAVPLLLLYEFSIVISKKSQTKQL